MMIHLRIGPRLRARLEQAREATGRDQGDILRRALRYWGRMTAAGVVCPSGCADTTHGGLVLRLDAGQAADGLAPQEIRDRLWAYLDDHPVRPAQPPHIASEDRGVPYLVQDESGGLREEVMV